MMRRLNLWGYVAVAVVAAAGGWWVAAPGTTWLNVYATVAWSAGLPFTLMGLFGAWRSRALRPPQFRGQLPNLVIFEIPTIGRLDTFPALDRVVRSIRAWAPWALAAWRIDIITEETAEGQAALCAWYEGLPEVRVLTVPRFYLTPRGTRYKARANHFGVEQRIVDGESRPDVWVYHLDDDTAVGLDTITAIAQHIAERGATHYLAQGVLAFPHELAPSWWVRVADAIRPTDDLARFFVFTGLWGRPWLGLHGENLLIRADIEYQVGWDFGASATVEDAYFGLRFAEMYPGRAAFLPAYTYGASPPHVGALIRQRKRWFQGMARLLLDPMVPTRAKWALGPSVLFWATAATRHVVVVLALAFLLGVDNTSPVWRPVAVIWGLDFAYWVWAYWQGWHANQRAGGGLRRRGDWLRVIGMVGTIPLMTAVEAAAALWGVWGVIVKAQGFDVIAKPM